MTGLKISGVDQGLLNATSGKNRGLPEMAEEHVSRPFFMSQAVDRPVVVTKSKMGPLERVRAFLGKITSRLPKLSLFRKRG